MPDKVILESLTTHREPSLARTFFPSNRITRTRAQADAIEGGATGAKWREVVDYNEADYPPPAWPANGSIPAGS